MRLSKYFLPTLEKNPSDAFMPSHRLMVRAGMIRKTAQGIYALLPLGFATLKRIKAIIRREHESIGALEMLMPTMQPSSIWEESGRYNDYGPEMLRTKDRHGHTLIYGPTNEEMITKIISENVFSYKQLPLLLYHIQWKFRDEIRPRFGVMRGREFLMKDAYSFHMDESEAKECYRKIFMTYLRIFRKVDMSTIPVVANSGPIGGSSHEFLVPCQNGESTFYYHHDILEFIKEEHGTFTDIQQKERYKTYKNLYTATDDVHDSQIFNTLPEEKRKVSKGIEIGHVFLFGDKYSRPLNATLIDKNDQKRFAFCGSYGIGITRLLAAIVEKHHDERGIIWPLSVAPFIVSLMAFGKKSSTWNLAQNLYTHLIKSKISCLYDDSPNGSFGEKLANMDLIGSPWQVIVGDRHSEIQKVEMRPRLLGEKGETEIIGINEVCKRLSSQEKRRLFV